MIKVRKLRMGRCPAKELKSIIMPQTINIGYGLFQLRPDGSRDIRAESRQFAKLIQTINSMSGQLVG